MSFLAATNPNHSSRNNLFAGFIVHSLCLTLMAIFLEAEGQFHQEEEVNWLADLSSQHEFGPDLQSAKTAHHPDLLVRTFRQQL